MANNAIILSDLDKVCKKERIAAGTIKPGHLLEQDTNGKVVVHNSAGLNAVPMFALEDAYADTSGSAKAIDTAYASNDSVFLGVCPRGVEVYALVAASATAVTNGAFLESAGDGTLRILTTDAATDDTQRVSVVAMALEAVDNSAGGSEARIKVMAV